MRDARKGAAFASGMRGREKPKVADSHGADTGTDAAGGGEKKQAPGAVIGQPDGVPHTDSVYSSGMRGLEKGNQKPAAQGGTEGPAGNPDGDNTAKRGAVSGVSDAQIQSTAKDAGKMGIDGNNLEQASQGEPIGAEEDDTHINIRVPKASISKRHGAGQAV